MVAELSSAATSAKLHEYVGSGSTRPAKLFIGGLTRNTTTKQLRDHFSAYGRVLDCVAMRQPDGRPRGFGYVTLDSSAAADRCLAVPQVVDGRVVDMKRAVPEGDVSEVPTTRLHTPGSRPAQTSVPQASFGSWAELAALSSPVNAYGFPMSPLSTMSPLGTVGPVMGDAACRWPWGLEDFSQARPDCLDLLSRGRSGLLSTSPQATPTGSMLPWSCPTTPTSHAGALSANAAEFVPFKSKKQDKALSRPVLGDISNTVGAKQDTKEAALATKKTTLLGSIPSPDNKNMDNAENVPPAADRPTKSLSQSRPFGLRETKALLICVDPEFEEEQPPAVEQTTSEPKEEPEALEQETVQVELPQACPSIPKEASEKVTEEADTCAVTPVEDDSLPSLGSADHAAGTCKRCNFFPKGRCQNGKSCTFCHLPHEKRKPSRQEKRERRSAWLAQQEAGHVGEMPEEFQDDDDEDDDEETDDVNHIMAYSVLPGLPPLRATKLPAPLALPGTGYPMVSMSSYGCGYPMPPPGLCLGPHMGMEAWQPDKEVSPHRRNAPASLLMMAPPLLATVPMAPCTPHSVAASPAAAVVKEMFLAASSPAAASVGQLRAAYGLEAAVAQAVIPQKPTMVTMATQTENEESSEEVPAGTASEDVLGTRQGGCTWTKTELLKFRASAQNSNGGAAPLKAMVVAKAEAN